MYCVLGCIDSNGIDIMMPVYSYFRRFYIISHTEPSPVTIIYI